MCPSLVLIGLGLTVLLSFFGPSTGVEPKRENTAVIGSCRDKLAECEKLRSQRAEALERLLLDKETLVGRIKAIGAKNKKELMAHPLGRTLVEEFEHLSRQIAQLRGEIDAIDSVAERGQSSLRSLEREAHCAGSEIDGRGVQAVVRCRPYAGRGTSASCRGKDARLGSQSRQTAQRSNCGGQ